MNASQILSSAANIVSLLAVAGVPIPASVLNVVNKGASVVNAVQTITSNPPTNITGAVSDLATAAGALQQTGLASADAEIETILNQVKQYTASLSNFESGQVAIVLDYNVSLNGTQKKAYLATFLEGGAAATALGL